MAQNQLDSPYGAGHRTPSRDVEEGITVHDNESDASQGTNASPQKGKNSPDKGNNSPDKGKQSSPERDNSDSDGDGESRRNWKHDSGRAPDRPSTYGPANSGNGSNITMRSGVSLKRKRRANAHPVEVIRLILTQIAVAVVVQMTALMMRLHLIHHT